MQLYKVRLLDPQASQPNEHINGYLGSFGELGVYGYREALRKAMMFKGRVEPHGKKYTTSVVEMLQLAKVELSETVQKELNERESFNHDDKDIGNPIYYGDIFDVIKTELTVGKYTDEIIEELTILNSLCSKYEYVMVM